MTINAYQLRCGIHGDTTTFENKYCTFKTNRGQDGSAFKRALGPFEYTQLDCYAGLQYYDGVRGNGGVGVGFYNGKYMGGGGHGYAMSRQEQFFQDVIQ